MLEEFQELANQLINEDFQDFKEEFEFINILQTEEYNEDTGQYEKEKESEFASGISLSMSKDLLSSGIYSSADLNVVLYFNDLPDFIDIGTELVRLKTGRKYVVAEYIPDPADASVSLIMKGV